MKRTYIIFFAILLSVMIVFGMIGKIYTSQWNYHGINKYLNVTVDDNQGIKLVKASKEGLVYTYHLQECSVSEFLTGQSIPLEDVIFEKLSIDEMIADLQVNKIDDSKVYEAENYNIHIIANNVVISDVETEITEIIEAINKK